MSGLWWLALTPAIACGVLALVYIVLDFLDW